MEAPEKGVKVKVGASEGGGKERRRNFSKKKKRSSKETKVAHMVKTSWVFAKL